MAPNKGMKESVVGSLEWLNGRRQMMKSKPDSNEAEQEEETYDER